MRSYDSESDSSTSSESSDISNYEDLVSLSSSVESSSVESDTESVSSYDSIEKYGFTKESENIKKDLLRCYNCLKKFNSLCELNNHNNKCIKYSETKNRE